MTASTPSPAQDAAEALRTDFVGFASFAVLVWDHLISLEDEVQYVWKGKKGPIVYLFFLNRYFTPLAFIINLYAYLSPSWTIERCERFIKYEGTTVAFAVEVVGLMMSLRIRALYPHQPFIAYFLWFLLTVETGLNAWLISGGRAVPHNPDSGVHCKNSVLLLISNIFQRHIPTTACSFIFDPKYSAAATSSAWFPLLYDSIVLLLTLYRTWPSIRRREAGFIMNRLFEDGLLYYSVDYHDYCGSSWPPKYHCSIRTTVAMMSRITLNLRKAGRLTGTEVITDGPNDMPFFNRRHRWDRDIYIETHVETHVSQPSPSEEMPTTPSDAVSRSTDIRFKVPTTPDSVALDDPFAKGRETYEMADFRDRKHQL
ncbi:hypothetical protein PLEOSDRAFT_169364 [Pleurotus ostreatus PC15]|uniref:DUF6533 domain-containing protein n=3 Tax=Pleurotus TaxID=5320 RepID=A0A067NB93_PLEO1|nr:hypothetical protein PLEOSDRAFT_169364 [Pleurotus ostreatus PC15]